MADIRQSTAILDDFNRANGSPGANWSQIWSPVWTQMAIQSNSLTHQAGSTTSHSYWNKDGPFSGDDAEAWGWAIGGNAGGAAWGIGLFTTGTGNGYRFRNTISGASDSDWHMEKYTGGSRVADVVNTAGRANGGFYMLIRRNGSAVEGWFSDDSVTWSLKVSMTDTSYTSGLWMTLASSDNSQSQLCDWDYFGGGLNPHRTQIYRILRGQKSVIPS